MIDRQAAERRRRRNNKSIRLLLYIFATVVILVLAGLTAHLSSMIGRLISQTTSEIKTVQTGVEATRAATSLNKQDLEEIDRTLRLHQELLNRSVAENRATTLLDSVSSYLDRLEANGQLKFGSPDEKQGIARRLRERIRSTVVNEMILKPELSDSQVTRRIEKLVDRHLAAVLNQ